MDHPALAIAPWRGPSGPAMRLARALELAPLEASEHRVMAAHLGPGATRILSAARAGRPVSADGWLAIHAVKGWDPYTSRAADPGMPIWRGALVWEALGLALRLAVMGRGVSARMLVAEAGVSASTWSRAATGQAVSVPHLERLCLYLNKHPHDLTSGLAGTRPGDEGCFPWNGHCNALFLQAHGGGRDLPGQSCAGVA